MHATNQSDTQGTAFAIAYESDLAKIQSTHVLESKRIYRSGDCESIAAWNQFWWILQLRHITHLPLCRILCFCQPTFSCLLTLKIFSGGSGRVFRIGTVRIDLCSTIHTDIVSNNVICSTPWNRLATYQVPAGLPACPPGGCTCAHLWIPKGCGQANMYVRADKGFRVQRTGS